MLVYNFSPGDLQGPSLFTGRFGKQNFFNVTVTNDIDQFLTDTNFKYLLINFYHFYIWQHNDPDNPYEYGFHQLISKLGPEGLEQVQTGNGSIVIDASYENFSYPIVHRLQEMFTRMDIKLDRISVIFPTSHGARLTREKFPDSLVRFCSVNTFELEAFQHLAWGRKRRFLMLHNRYSVDRAWMHFSAWRAGILDNAYATFGIKKFNHLFVEGETSVPPLMKQTISEEVNSVYNDSDLAHWILNADDNRFPYTSELELDDKRSLNTNYSEFLLAHHNATHLAMISESYESPRLGLNNNGFDGFYFPTEKTFRTIGMRQPFLVYASQYFLKYLREQGYKTFSPFLDERYDEIVDDRQRQLAVFNEFNRLDKMADHEFYPLMEQLNEIAEFNYQHFMNRRNNVLHSTYFEDQVLANHFLIHKHSG